MTKFLKCLNMSCLAHFISDGKPDTICPMCGTGELTERHLSEITPSELRLLLREEFELSKKKINQ